MDCEETQRLKVAKKLAKEMRELAEYIENYGRIPDRKGRQAIENQIDNHWGSFVIGSKKDISDLLEE